MPRVTLTASKRFMNALAIARQEDREKKDRKVKAPRRPTHRVRDVLQNDVKLKKYLVTITREIEHTAVLEVDAESADVAKQMAESVVDNHRPSLWREGDILSYTAKTKVIG